MSSAAQPLEPERFDDRTPRVTLGAAAAYVVGLLLLIAIVWFIYDQMTAVRGVKVEAPSPQVVSMLPPPPPPPPPPPEPKEKPPEPTEQPQPSPVDAPKAPQQPQAAPVSIAAPAQAGSDAFGLSAGTGGGIGKPGSTGTCLGANCGAAAGGGGIGEGLYRRYLSSALQERVQGDQRVNRLLFSADFAITVTSGGTVTTVRLVRSSGRDERDATLAAILERVRGLDPPPAAMRFPQRITVRGRRAL